MCSQILHGQKPYGASLSLLLVLVFPWCLPFLQTEGAVFKHVLEGDAFPVLLPSKATTC